MLYHYSVAGAASQGTGPLSATFAARLARGGSSTDSRKTGLTSGCAGLRLESGGLHTRDAPAFRFLRQNDGHANAAGIWFLRLRCGFPDQRRHGGFAADELDIFDFSDSLGPSRCAEDAFCSLPDLLGTNPQIPVRIHKLAPQGEQARKISRLAVP